MTSHSQPVVTANLTSFVVARHKHLEQGAHDAANFSKHAAETCPASNLSRNITHETPETGSNYLILQLLLALEGTLQNTSSGRAAKGPTLQVPPFECMYTCAFRRTHARKIRRKKNTSFLHVAENKTPPTRLTLWCSSHRKHTIHYS